MTAPTVKLSFQGTGSEDLTPRVVLYNPEVLTFACLTQVQRFGLIGDRKSAMAGRLKGSRKNLTEMLQSYGNNVEIVRASSAAHASPDGATPID